MEGLGARFGQFMAAKREADSFPGGPGSGKQSWEQQQQQQQNYRNYAPGQYQNQPSFVNSVPPRKRASPSASAASSMPVLPPKKQHVDSSGVDYSFPKGDIKFHFS